MARLAARWWRSNLVILVTLKQGNYLAEAYVRKGQRKSLYRRQRDSLEGPHEEAEIQRKALRRGKNLAFSEDTCLEKVRVRSKVTLKQVGVGLKRRWELSKRRLGWSLAWWGLTEKMEASHLLGLRGRHQYSDQRSNQNRISCVASTAMGTEEEENQIVIWSAQREQLTEEEWRDEDGHEKGRRREKTGDRFLKSYVLPFCGRSGGSTAKNARGNWGLWEGQQPFGTNSKRGRGPHHRV